jgi:Fe-S oxidoreductase
MDLELFFRLLGFFVVFVSIVSLSLALQKRVARYRDGRPGPAAAAAGPDGARAVRAEAARRAGRDRFAALAHTAMVTGAVLSLAAHAISVAGRLPFPAAPALAVIGFVVFMTACVLMAGGALAALARRVLRRPRLSLAWREIAPHLSLILIAASGIVYGACLTDTTPGALIVAARFGHMLSIALFIFLVGRTTLLHLALGGRLERTGFRPLTGALTADEAVARLAEPGGKDKDAETIGLAGAEGFSGEERLRLDLCSGCGFCDAACPAALTGKSLSPRRIIDLERRASNGPAAGRSLAENGELAAMTDECTLCFACDAACPHSVEHADKIVRLRRHQVLERGRAPAPWRKALALAERHDNIFGDMAEERRRLTAALGLRNHLPGMKVDFLLWLGCYSVWDHQMRGTLAALVRLLAAAGRTAAVLENEPCCGDMPRRMGDEHRFRELALKNIGLLGDLGGARLLTVCPHCAHSFKKEYPALGGNIDAVHYLEVLEELAPAARTGTASGKRRAVYHDSCYLGRLGGRYEAPRRALAGLDVRIELVALRDERENSLCCGGGGGRILMEENGRRASLLKIKEAAARGADLLVTSCPYCRSLYRDAAASLGGRFEVKDLLEVLAGG